MLNSSVFEIFLLINFCDAYAPWMKKGLFSLQSVSHFLINIHLILKYDFLYHADVRHIMLISTDCSLISEFNVQLFSLIYKLNLYSGNVYSFLRFHLKYHRIISPQPKKTYHNIFLISFKILLSLFVNISSLHQNKRLLSSFED